MSSLTTEQKQGTVLRGVLSNFFFPLHVIERGVVLVAHSSHYQLTAVLWGL